MKIKTLKLDLKLSFNEKNGAAQHDDYNTSEDEQVFKKLSVNVFFY